MTTIDKIRAEIKRLKAENNCGTDEFIAAKDIAYDKVFDFLENLEEPVSDCHDLEEAADDHIRKVVDAAGHPGWDWETQDIADAFKAGAEWQKRKIMEGAVEGVVYRYESYQRIATAIIVDINRELLGNKVKIIIVKEDGQ